MAALAGLSVRLPTRYAEHCPDCGRATLHAVTPTGRAVVLDGAPAERGEFVLRESAGRVWAMRANVSDRRHRYQPHSHG